MDKILTTIMQFKDLYQLDPIINSELVTANSVVAIDAKNMIFGRFLSVLRELTKKEKIKKLVVYNIEKLYFKKKYNLLLDYYKFKTERFKSRQIVEGLYLPKVSNLFVKRIFRNQFNRKKNSHLDQYNKVKFYKNIEDLALKLNLVYIKNNLEEIYSQNLTSLKTLIEGLRSIK